MAVLVVAAAVVVSGSVGADPPPAATFQGLFPARLADTRANGQTVDAQSQGTGPIAAGTFLDVAMLGRGGVPASGVGAVALNVTAINPTAASFLTVYPAGAARPNASNLTLAEGRTLPNMVIVPLGDGGQVSVYNDQGATHLAVDVLGWFPTTINPASTTRVSVATGGAQATGGDSDSAAISADGRYITVESGATNLVAGDTNSRRDVFVHDRHTGTTTRVSVNTAGDQSTGPSAFPAISADGRYVTFSSYATNFVAGDTNGEHDVFVHDQGST